jgi:hypothetical protein
MQMCGGPSFFFPFSFLFSLSSSWNSRCFAKYKRCPTIFIFFQIWYSFFFFWIFFYWFFFSISSLNNWFHFFSSNLILLLLISIYFVLNLFFYSISSLSIRFIENLTL